MPPDLSSVRSLRVRLLLPLSLVLAVVAIGTVGYHWLWRHVGGTWMDALFMTVTTITTIGYGEIKPLTTAGRLFTIVLAVIGIGSMFYTLGVVMEYLVSVRLADPVGRRRMERQIVQLSSHVIVAGMGRVGTQAALELHGAGAPFVVIDARESAIQLARERGYLALVGDASRDEVLAQAGIRRARGLIVTTGDDATSVYVVLSARVLNPELYIVARATDEAGVTKVLRAGANRAVSPYAIGSHRLAHLMLSPAVVDFFETAFRRGQDALAIEDLALPADSPCVGRTLDTLDIRRATGATVLAILRDGNPVASPPGDFALAGGDHLLALGTGDQLRRLEKMITAGGAGAA